MEDEVSRKRCIAAAGMAAFGFMGLLAGRIEAMQDVSRERGEEVERSKPPKTREYFEIVERMGEEDFKSHFRVSRREYSSMLYCSVATPDPSRACFQQHPGGILVLSCF